MHSGFDFGIVAYLDFHMAAVAAAGNLPVEMVVVGQELTNTCWVAAVVVAGLEEQSHVDFEGPALRMPPCRQFQGYP